MNPTFFETRADSRAWLAGHQAAAGFLWAAWKFFQGQPASYRTAACWSVAGGKKDETRRKRLDSLVAHSARAERLPQFTRRKPSG